MTIKLDQCERLFDKSAIIYSTALAMLKHNCKYYGKVILLYAKLLLPYFREPSGTSNAAI